MNLFFHLAFQQYSKAIFNFWVILLFFSFSPKKLDLTFLRSGTAVFCLESFLRKLV